MPDDMEEAVKSAMKSFFSSKKRPKKSSKSYAEENSEIFKNAWETRRTARKFRGFSHELDVPWNKMVSDHEGDKAEIYENLGDYLGLEEEVVGDLKGCQETGDRARAVEAITEEIRDNYPQIEENILKMDMKAVPSMGALGDIYLALHEKSKDWKKEASEKKARVGCIKKDLENARIPNNLALRELKKLDSNMDSELKETYSWFNKRKGKVEKGYKGNKGNEKEDSLEVIEDMRKKRFRDSFENSELIDEGLEEDDKGYWRINPDSIPFTKKEYSEFLEKDYNGIVDEVVEGGFSSLRELEDEHYFGKIKDGEWKVHMDREAMKIVDHVFKDSEKDEDGIWIKTEKTYDVDEIKDSVFSDYDNEEENYVKGLAEGGIRRLVDYEKSFTVEEVEDEDVVEYRFGINEYLVSEDLEDGN